MTRQKLNEEQKELLNELLEGFREEELLPDIVCLKEDQAYEIESLREEHREQLKDLREEHKEQLAQRKQVLIEEILEGMWD